MGNNKYSRSIDEKMNVLNTFLKTTRHGGQKKPHVKQKQSEGVFAQKQDISEMKCYIVGVKNIMQKHIQKKTGKGGTHLN